MGKLEETTFRKWADHVKVKKFLLNKMAKHLVGAQREKFGRWRKFAETSLKMKRLVGKHFVGITRACFVAWFGWTGKSIKAKRMFAKGLVGLQKMVFQMWRGVTGEMARERRERELWLGHQKPENFFAIDDWGSPEHTAKPFKRNFVPVKTRWRVY
jgi:hypothetical protein